MEDIDPALRAKGDEVIRLVKSGQELVIVTGPAGTGKTKLISYIVSHLQNVSVVAYTGQAARMLGQRGLAATTLHSLIYQPAEARLEELKVVDNRMKELEAEEKQRSVEYVELRNRRRELIAPGFLLKDAEDLSAVSLIVIDEVSMIGEKLGGNVESFGIPIVAVGDPYQLRPVPDQSGNDEAAFDLDAPHVHLDRIFRQKEGSEILDIATDVRHGKGLWLPPHKSKSVRITRRADMTEDKIQDAMLKADQVICFTNDTRRRINHLMLKAIGHPPGLPNGSEGEKIICLRNNADLDLTNGQPIRLTQVADEGEAVSFTADVAAEDKNGQWTPRGRHPVYRGRLVAKLNEKHKVVDERARIDLMLNPGLIDCDWGFAVTVHKAQGSEWPRVLYIHESDDPRLNYTAVTRAQERLDIITDWRRN
jgi:exodeoxyribonuclease-5